MSNHFWFEATTSPQDGTWLYQVGTGDNTPVALVAGRNEHEAAARARIICKALNDAARAAALAANHDGDD